MAVVLALLAAAGWGSSDYAAGVASRRSSALSVVVLTHGVTAGLLVAVLVLADPHTWTQAGLALRPGPAGRPVPVADLLWGACGGVGGGVGAVMLFRGLARGAVAVVAPITAVVAAALPVVAGLVTGEALGPAAAVALPAALVAVVLISTPPAPVARHRHRGSGRRPWRPSGRRIAPVRSRSTGAHARRAGLLRGGDRHRAVPGVFDALVSGVGFGSFYLLLGHTGDEAGLWPILSARTTSVLIFALAALVVRQRLLPAPPDRRAVVVAGALDALAAALFLAATRQGLLSVVAVLASLYPAATIGLARMLDRERCSAGQVAGLGLAALAVGVLAVS